MPIYEYQCDSCGAQRELILKHGEVARPTCSACRKRMRRVISKTAFILKGSGWYVTDYPSDARKKGMEGEKPRPQRRPPGEEGDRRRGEEAGRRGEEGVRCRGEKDRRCGEKAVRAARVRRPRKEEATKKEGVTLPLCHLIMTDSDGARTSYL